MAGNRGAREGSIYRRKGDGRWVAAISLPGRGQKYFYAKTKEAARERLRAAIRAQEQGLPVAAARQTLAQFLERWLVDSARPKLRERTFESYATVVRRHLIPSLGHHQLARLSPEDVERYLNREQAAGRISRRAGDRKLSARTVQYHRAILRRALNVALKRGYVYRIVATLTDPPRVERGETKPLNLAQVRALLDAARGHRLEALLTAALSTGMRQGELLGLRWVDVDLDAGTLHVRKQLQRINNKLEMREPKTARSRRVIALLPDEVEVLRTQRAGQLQERLMAGSRWQDSGLVFANTLGGPLDARGVVKQFKALLERAGLPRDVRFHDLRHTNATWLRAMGADLRLVMERLGHSTITLTANTYQHIDLEMQREAMAKLGSLLDARR